MHHAVQQVMADRTDRAMHMAGLPALVTMRPDQLGAAIQAQSALPMAMPLAMSPLDRTAQQCAVNDFTRCFQFPHEATLSAWPSAGDRDFVAFA